MPGLGYLDVFSRERSCPAAEYPVRNVIVFQFSIQSASHVMGLFDPNRGISFLVYLVTLAGNRLPLESCYLGLLV